jgi:ABC-type nickel/cobalt efflux system permease component RcnA
MSPTISAVAAIGLLLGLRHAFEPDHLAAVSTLATRPAARLWSAARLGLVWGLGHTATVGIVVLFIMVLGIQVPERFWPTAELLVAALLILLGSVVIWRYIRGRWHMHAHNHASGPHLHFHSHAEASGHEHAHRKVDARRSLGFGIAHGLAGSGAIAALLVAAAPDAASRIAYFAAFGIGTIVGMLGVSLTLSMVVRAASSKSERWATALHVGAAALSVVAGVVLAQRVIFTP